MKIFLLNLFFVLAIQYVSAQKITYNTEQGFPLSRTEFNIIGKIGNRYLIHINNNYSHNQSRFCLYDSNMRLISTEKPKMREGYFGIYFICYPKFAYLFYQYTKRDRTFLAVMKFDSTGKITEAAVNLAEGKRETSFLSTPVFNIINSENKTRIAIFSVENFEDQHELKLFVFNQNLEKKYEKVFSIFKSDPHESIGQFTINDAGDFIFLKKNEFDEESPFKYLLNYIRFEADHIEYYDVTSLKVICNDMRVYADNSERDIHIFSFYADSTLNVFGKDVALKNARTKSGIFYAAWNIDSNKLSDAQLIPFNSFISDYSDDPKFMQLPLQSFRQDAFFKKSSGGFILQGWHSGYNDNTYLQNFFRWKAQQSRIRQYIDYSHYLSYNIPFFKSENRSAKLDMFFISFNKSDSVEKFTFHNNYESGFNIFSMKTAEGIHYISLYSKGGDEYADHFLLNASGEFIKQAPLNNIKDHEIFSYGSLQVSSRELLFPFIFNHKLNFGKIEF